MLAHHAHSWVWVYSILVGLVIAISAPRSVLYFIVTLRASTRVHDSVVMRLLRAPLSFFHRNPAGRILNRLSKGE